MVRSMSTRGVTDVPIAMGKGKQRFGKYRAGAAPTPVPRISGSTASTVRDDQSVFSYKHAGDGDDYSTYDNYSVYDMSVVDGASCFTGGDSVMGESLFDEQSMYHDNTVYGEDQSMYQQHLAEAYAEPEETPTLSIPTDICLAGSMSRSALHDESFTNHDQSHTSFSHSQNDLELGHEHDDDEEDQHEHEPSPVPTTSTTTTTNNAGPHTTAPKPVPILKKKNTTTCTTSTSTATTNANISVAPTDESSYETHSTPERAPRPNLADTKKCKNGLWKSLRGKKEKSTTTKDKKDKKSWFSKMKRTKAEF